jgi:hypothetical protein
MNAGHADALRPPAIEVHLIESAPESANSPSTTQSRSPRRTPPWPKSTSPLAKTAPTSSPGQ